MHRTVALLALALTMQLASVNGQPSQPASDSTTQPFRRWSLVVGGMAHSPGPADDLEQAMIAEAARQGYTIFVEVMEGAYRSGQPSALAAFEATGRAYLRFARDHPGHYIAMFESGISVNRTPELAQAAGRASAVLERAESLHRDWLGKTERRNTGVESAIFRSASVYSAPSPGEKQSGPMRFRLP